ncbi:neurohypophysial n-terminal domain containing protein [Stylonychia lemnae]|uniref:Neurohypophysial n-terminal domain containing protein n=1 Tax=Stylonychia lemnae TaxID=5949 RepID=A0A078B605_STYLE|nr:neurohypophysial n-terminal domain containing protein [Stylonychia lemnae]|eukprot:CDW89849.1 neurohypophysial n-terminal domain containing protein [Stylonychia lemnae]
MCANQDNYSLKVKAKLSNHTVCFDNPLYGTDPKKYGYYDFWIRLNPNENFMMYDWQEILKFQFSGSGSHNVVFYSQRYFQDNWYQDFFGEWYMISHNWVNIVIGFSPQNQNWVKFLQQFQVQIVSIDRAIQNPKMNGYYNHPKSICMFKLRVNDPSTYVQLNQFKFWSFSPTQLTNNFNGFDDFLERYYGQSFKYYNFTLPPSLVEYFSPKPQGSSNTWVSSMTVNYVPQVFGGTSHMEVVEIATFPVSNAPITTILNALLVILATFIEANILVQNKIVLRANTLMIQRNSVKFVLFHVLPQQIHVLQILIRILASQFVETVLKDAKHVMEAPHAANVQVDIFYPMAAVYLINVITNRYPEKQITASIVQKIVNNAIQLLVLNVQIIPISTHPQCKENNYTCTQCDSTTYLFNNKCVKNCPMLGFFQDPSKRLCVNCDSLCTMCSSNATDCIACKPGSLYSNRKCLNSCGLREYASSEGFCYPCDVSCNVCYGSLNSLCTKCNIGFFQKENTCLEVCPAKYYPELATQKCEKCKFYCDQCKTKDTCQSCQPGFIPTKTNCTGEYFMKTGENKSLSVQFNEAQIPSLYNPLEITAEIWFRGDNMLGANPEVILGMTPYKLRKKAGSNSIHINFQTTFTFCETNETLDDQKWYHFAFAISEKLLNISCYLDGNQFSIGQNSRVVIAMDVIKPTELVFGSSKTLLGQEKNFNGYIKEFRLWKKYRSDFEIKHLRYVTFLVPSTDLIAYWKLNEKNDGTVSMFKDSSIPGTNNQDSMISIEPNIIQDLVEFKEVYHLICSDGFYQKFNITAGYYQCYSCDPLCKNCIGPLNTQCSECYPPFKLLQEEMTCQIIESCPQGYYMDPENGLCFKCQQFCDICTNSPTNCSICKKGTFHEYLGTGCVDNCPNDMYGNYQTQLCYQNPTVDWITPLSDTQFLFGEFIEVRGNFTLLNNEPRSTYTYGWKVLRVDGDVDISFDAVKPYFETDIRIMHLDNNILQPYNYYRITLYVKGDTTKYKNLYSYLTIQIYLGSAPKNGKCIVSPIQGIATVTNFNITQKGWEDTELITQYQYFFSFDNGQIYLPIDTEERIQLSIQYKFNPIYQKFAEIRIMCRATNIKGFSSQTSTMVIIEKKSNSDAEKDLGNMNTVFASTETEILLMIKQLNLISQFLGNLKVSDTQVFDPKIEESQCIPDICNLNGACVFLPYIKKYYCNCTENFGGQNCSFSNKTQISMIKTNSMKLGQLYDTLTDKQYEFEFLILATTFRSMISNIQLEIIISILNDKLAQSGDQALGDKELQIYLNIVSNLLEYLEEQIIISNITENLQNDPIKLNQYKDQLDSILQIFNILRQNTLQQISMLLPEKQFTSRMISYKQSLISKETLLSYQATQSTSRRSTTYIKVSEINYEDANVELENDFIIEAIEYALNPYQIINTFNLSNNIFEVTMYNASDKAKANIKDLKNGFQIFFPFQDNGNLTQFAKDYNSLSPFKAKQKFKRDSMIESSHIKCTYWNGTFWSNSGCIFLGFENTHIKCGCNHLTAISPTFITPRAISTGVEVFINRFIKSAEKKVGNIELGELLVPFGQYFSNLQELLQHKTPNPISFIFKPGPYIVIFFWFMYISSIVYYSGSDRLKRNKMTKSQNRIDLAEISDDQIQCLNNVIKDLMAKDKSRKVKNTISESSPEKQQTKNDSPFKYNMNNVSEGYDHYKSDVNMQTCTFDNAEQANRSFQACKGILTTQFNNNLSNEELEIYKKRARKRIFGRVGDVNERARRVYKDIFHHNQYTPENKMKFFNEALRSNLWFGLMAKTSKIAPRHVRLTLLYLHISIQLLVMTFSYLFAYQDKLAVWIDFSMISTLAICSLPLMVSWILAFPVALIFRMPMDVRRQIQGVRAKKLNKVFQNLENQMGCRYAIGYSISFTFFIMMTILVIFLNYVYPTDYCMNWFIMVFVLFIMDMLVYTFAFAGLQLINIIISVKFKPFYHVWATLEIIRYYKNLRG